MDIDTNSYCIGYAAAIEDFSRYFDIKSSEHWSDNSYCMEVINANVDVLDHMRKQVAIELGMNNRIIE